MNGSLLRTAATPSRPVALVPLAGTRDVWARRLGPILSALVLAAVAWQLRDIDLPDLGRLFPRQPLFWIAFAAYYLASPGTEWLIFRRLWRLPAAGIRALLLKLVSNELLLGYAGEVYFYAWARRHARIAAAPFAAIKDVAILSALVGNLFTLALTIAAWPLLRTLPLPVGTRTLAGSLAVVLATPVAALALRGRLFALPAADLRMAAAMHAARTVGMLVLAAFMWHLLLPAVALHWWLLLATLRQLVSRLPLVPNKDLVFAGIVASMVGPASRIVEVPVLMATLLVAAHLLVGAVLAAAEIAGTNGRTIDADR